MNFASRREFLQTSIGLGTAAILGSRLCTWAVLAAEAAQPGTWWPKLAMHDALMT